MAVSFLMVATAPGIVAAEVIAEFTGTEVDSYPGMAGDGWADAWTPVVTRGNLTAAVVESGDDLGSGNYLDIALTPTSATQTGAASVSRRYYDGIELAQPHAIEFKYRIDEDITGSGSTFATSNDRYQLFDTASDRTTANATCSWIVGVYATGAKDAGYISEAMIGHWVVFDGTNGSDFVAANQVDTTLVAQPGVVYDFKITIDPDSRTYSAWISDGTATFSQGGLGWRTTAASVAGRVQFGCIGDTLADTRAWSMDAIKITQVPEPSMLALLAALGAAGALATGKKG
ncbi:MAG: hypothetical protein JW809_16640 [Pirellulales bacterium]|nr:hypothetical protein [Pirellulales bacterium]